MRRWWRLADPVVRPLEGTDDHSWVVERHGDLYAEEVGWDRSFQTLVADVVADLARRDSSRDAGWIGEADGRRAGSVVCMAKDSRTAKLRLLLVEPWARGRGVGGALVDECIAFAHRARFDELELWTTANLTSARKLYESRGFTLVREYREARFGAELVSLDFALTLS